MAEETKYQGETIRLEAVVLDANGAAAVLTDATCYFICPGQQAGDVPISEVVTPAGNVLSYDIEPVTSATMRGTYEYAFWVRIGDEQDRVASGTFTVLDGPGVLPVPVP